jgi:hypothetical protein
LLAFGQTGQPGSFSLSLFHPGEGGEPVDNQTKQDAWIIVAVALVVATIAFVVFGH